MIIGAVLHTDMTQHFPMVSKVRLITSGISNVIHFKCTEGSSIINFIELSLQLEVFNEMHAAEIQAAHKSQRQVLRTM